MSFHTDIWELHRDWCYGNPVILYGLIRSMKPQVVVEVGTYRGFSASWMAQALKENWMDGFYKDGTWTTTAAIGTPILRCKRCQRVDGHDDNCQNERRGHLYCIDNFSLRDHEGRHGDARAHLEANLNAVGVRDWITILDGDSNKVMWPESCQFSYVDGWHSYLAAKHDFEQCAKRGAECICLDDAVQSVGPRMLTHEIRATGDWDVVDVLRDCGMAICMRKLKNGPITFSQENPDHTGIDLQVVSREYQIRHLEEQGRRNGVDYSSIYPLLHEGEKTP